MSNQVHIIALEYHEPYYAETRQCIRATELPVQYACRQGIGNFSAAMNEAFRRLRPADDDLVWFITDITFDPKTPHRLAERFKETPELWALHPEHPSDHRSHQPNGTKEVQFVPYIEFTAPMVRASTYMALGGLDENHHYWYQDLIFSKGIRDLGGLMGVDHGNPIQHIYRRDKVEHEVTRQRYALRKQRDQQEISFLQARYGPNWRQVLWPR